MNMTLIDWALVFAAIVLVTHWRTIFGKPRRRNRSEEKAVDKSQLADLCYHLRKAQIEVLGSFLHPEPTVQFRGRGKQVAFKALAVALAEDLPVNSLRRFWEIVDGDIEDVFWQITFVREDDEEEEPDSADDP